MISSPARVGPMPGRQYRSTGNHQDDFHDQPSNHKKNNTHPNHGPKQGSKSWRCDSQVEKQNGHPDQQSRQDAKLISIIDELGYSKVRKFYTGWVIFQPSASRQVQHRSNHIYDFLSRGSWDLAVSVTFKLMGETVLPPTVPQDRKEWPHQDLFQCEIKQEYYMENHTQLASSIQSAASIFFWMTPRNQNLAAITTVASIPHAIITGIPAVWCSVAWCEFASWAQEASVSVGMVSLNTSRILSSATRILQVTGQR